jgi:hypothetical protein
MQTSTHPVTEELTIIESAPIADEGSLPIIRIDQNGKILFANDATFVLFSETYNMNSEYIPEDFMKRIPGMLNLNADFSVPIEVSSTVLTFDVIGFEECGYIGLYGRSVSAA